MKCTLILLATLLVSCASQDVIQTTDQATDPAIGDDNFIFSLVELQSAKQGNLAPVQTINASDQTQLAYRAYLPGESDSILVFYHGGTAHSGLGYQHLADDLSRQYNIAVYTPDVRGHGYSGGRRGDSPTMEQVWDDISVFVRYVKSLHPNKKVFLGGHSAGAGMLLNYSDYADREVIAGYLYLSPYLGFRAKLDTEAAQSFATVKQELFIENAINGTEGNSYAVQFHLPAGQSDKDLKTVDAITVNMSKARTPSAPAAQLEDMHEPLVMWIGEFDEAIDAQRATNYINENNPDAETTIIEGENHLGILVSAADFIGPWLQQQ